MWFFQSRGVPFCLLVSLNCRKIEVALSRKVFVLLRSGKILFCLVGFVLLGFTTTWAAPVTGKVTLAGGGVAGLRVSAYPLDVMDFSGDAVAVTEPTGDDGKFSLNLEVGQYYFFAEGTDYFTYYGRNPVSVPRDGITEMNLTLARRDTALPTTEPLITEGLSGQINFSGKPLAGAIISIYPDLNTQLKGMGYGMSTPTDENGYFELPLPAGTYYLVARKRANGQMTGPLSSGDHFGYFAGNPLMVKAGVVNRIGIDMVEVPEKVSRLADTMFGKTSIHGKVLNAVGSAVVGVRVLLYADETMLNRPLYVSQPSAADGSYVLSFPKGGTYFLAARNKLGGAPGPGELYGRYNGSQDGSIRVRTGQKLEDIDLLVQEMW